MRRRRPHETLDAERVLARAESLEERAVCCMYEHLQRREAEALSRRARRGGEERGRGTRGVPRAGSARGR